MNVNFLLPALHDQLLYMLCTFKRAFQQVRRLEKGMEYINKATKNLRRKENVQPKKWYPSHKLFYVLSAVTILPSFLVKLW